MAPGKPPLTVVYSAGALDDLRELWRYNADHRGVRQANAYEDFLVEGIDALAEEYGNGKSVESHPHLLRITLRMRGRGHGHIVVYEPNEAAGEITILQVCHTAQDLPGRIR